MAYSHFYNYIVIFLGAMFFFASSSYAQQSSVQLLPPTPPNSNRTIDCTANQVLSYNASSNKGSAINCSPVTITSGNLSVTGGNITAAGTLSTGAVLTGTACSPEGALAYDITNHNPVYCNQSNVWATTLGGGITDGAWCGNLIGVVNDATLGGQKSNIGLGNFYSSATTSSMPEQTATCEGVTLYTELAQASYAVACPSGYLLYDYNSTVVRAGFDGQNTSNLQYLTCIKSAAAGNLGVYGGK